MLNDMAISGLNAGSVLSMFINHQAIDWIKELLEYPKEAGGVFVVGGSEANFTGLAVARNTKAEVDMKIEGMQGVPRKMILYCSEEGHDCLDRSVELLGLGNGALRWIKTDDDCRIVINALKDSIEEDRRQGYYPFCVIGNAGTVNSGAFDDLNGLADLCKKENLWFHVDGAFGAWVKLSETHKHLADGLDRADSVAVDLHKWMNMQYSIGCALVKDRVAHFSTFVYGHDAEYLKTGMKELGGAMDNILNLSLALSRPDYGTKAYMLLRAFGREKYSDLVQQNIDQMHYLAELVKEEPNMELTAPVASNIVCFRYFHDGLTEDELEKLNRMILGELWKISFWMISDTTIKGKYMLRACNVNNRTRREDFDFLVDEVKKIGVRCVKELK
jgi:glutamate/tyrosine decarboxylase-like PLP-dependent enzyme